MSYHHHEAGSKCGDSIKISPEHSRSLVYENVTQYSAANPCQHSHKCSHHWVESGGQRFLRPGNGEQS